MFAIVVILKSLQRRWFIVRFKIVYLLKWCTKRRMSQKKNFLTRNALTMLLCDSLAHVNICWDNEFAADSTRYFSWFKRKNFVDIQSFLYYFCPFSELTEVNLFTFSDIFRFFTFFDILLHFLIFFYICRCFFMFFNII